MTKIKRDSMEYVRENIAYDSSLLQKSNFLSVDESTKRKIPMNHCTLLLILLLCVSYCGSSPERPSSNKTAVDTTKRNVPQQSRKRPENAFIKKEPDWRAWKTDTATGRQFFLIDDTSSVMKDEKKLIERAADFAFYTQGRKWNGKPIKIAVFSRATPLRRDEKYKYVGNKKQIPPDLREEWKRRYIADYDCQSDTITFYPADPTRKKTIFFHWKGVRYKGNRVIPGEAHPNDLFRFDTLP